MNGRSDGHFSLPTFVRAPGAIAVDLDGTLLDSRGRLSQRNREALERCIAHGIPVIIATSRAARSVRRFLGGELTANCSHVLLTGAVGIGAPPFSGLIREALPPGAAGDIVELTLRIEPRARLSVEVDGYEFATNVRLGPDDLWEEYSATPDMVWSLEETLARAPTKVAVSGRRAGLDLTEIALELSRRFGDAVSTVLSDGATYLHCTSATASKARTLRHLLQRHGIPLANVLAFGDDLPDLDMLAGCGLSVAAGNAVPEVMAVSKYRTASNDDDGVAVALEKMLVDLAW